MTEFSNDEMAEFEAQYEDLDQKTIQISQLVELQRIRTLLEHGLSGSAEESTESTTYECIRCETRVNADNRREHIEESHNAPPDLDLSTMYEVVE